MEQSRKLRKSRNKWIDGVLGGLGEYFQVNPDLLRVGFIILVALNFQILIGAYFILMIFMPGQKRRLEDDRTASDLGHASDVDWDEDADDFEEYDNDYDDEDHHDYKGSPAHSGRSLQFFGGLLIFIGIYVLFQDQMQMYSRHFYSQLRQMRYYLIPYREGIMAGILILVGTLLWWRGRK